MKQEFFGLPGDHVIILLKMIWYFDERESGWSSMRTCRIQTHQTTNSSNLTCQIMNSLNYKLVKLQLGKPNLSDYKLVELQTRRTTTRQMVL